MREVVKHSSTQRKSGDFGDAFGWCPVGRGMKGRGMTLYTNVSDFIPLTMIPLTDLAVGNATGRAYLSRGNQDENGFDARPHPGPLPRGEGESFAGFLEGRRLVLAGTRRAIRGRAMATPSPWGEGRGEGGRKPFLSEEWALFLCRSFLCQFQRGRRRCWCWFIEINCEPREICERRNGKLFDTDSTD